MAVGDITYNGSYTAEVKILSAATGDTSAPSAATDGVDLTTLQGGQSATKAPPVASIAIFGTGTTPTMKAKLWVYDPVLAKWLPYGTNATAANKGDLNAGNAIGGEVTNEVLHAETVQFVGHFTRAALQVHGSSGLTSVDAYLIVPRVTAVVDK